PRGDFGALLPAPAVLPSFEPIPRPTRTLRCREPFGGRRLDKLTATRPLLPAALPMLGVALRAVFFGAADFFLVFFFSAITYSPTSTRCRTLRIMPRIAGVSWCSTT